MDYTKKGFGYNDQDISGWSAYLDEFCSHGNDYDNNVGRADSCSSMVSDAAWNGFMTTKSMSGVQKSKSSNSKKNPSRMPIWIKGFGEDDDLQDTASSPANSPKVGSRMRNKNKMRMDESYFRRRDDRHNHGLFMENGESCENMGLVAEVEQDWKNMEDVGRRNDYIDLKKRGLCLVDVSTFINSYMR